MGRIPNKRNKCGVYHRFSAPHSWDVCDDNPERKEHKPKTMASYTNTKHVKGSDKNDSMAQLQPKFPTHIALVNVLTEKSN